MHTSDFKSTDAGRLVATNDGYMAFVPAPLPPTIAYDNDLVLTLSHADAALSELAGLGRNLPNPHLLIVPYTRREAVLSSRIEGTRANISDILLEEAEDAPTRREENADVREVRNYIAALDYGVAQLSSLPLSLRLVRNMHEILLSGVRGEKKRPGEFRKEQNWVGGTTSTLANALYVPPPPAEMMDALHAWEKFINERDSMPDLVQCALMHAQFESIHPFLDGNGRLGRLFITLFLLERKRLGQPLLYLSAYIEKHKQDYYDLLQGVRTDGAWESWLRFFLRGVAETAQAGVRQASQLMDLRETYRARLRDKPTAQALLDALFVNPYVTIAGAATRLKVSRPAVGQAVLLLQELGLLEEISGRSWRRIYLAMPILRAIDPEEFEQS